MKEAVYDILITNGYVVDGSGNPWFKADIGVRNGKIIDIGNLASMEAKKVLEAKGLVVSPGFIDIHTHSDFTLLANPTAESHVHQGITTDVIGNCGESPAPVSDHMKESSKELMEAYSISWDWSTLGEYMDKLERQGISLNVAPLIGQGTIRMAVMGYENRHPTEEELAKMKGYIAKAMEAGAFGMSSGLFYAPSGYADTDELIELCKVVAKYDGIYATHIREEGDSVIDAVNEAIEIGEKSGAPVHISHHKAAGPRNWGKVNRALKNMEEAMLRDVDVTCDVYPWDACSNGLSACIPQWAHEGGVDKMLERLRDKNVRQRLRKEMVEGIPGWESQVAQSGFGRMRIASCPKHIEYEGRIIDEIAKSRGEDPFDFAFDLLLEEEGKVNLVVHEMSEEDVCTIIKHPLSMMGSDGSSVALSGFLGQGKRHPRTYGTYPRLFDRYVREKKVVTLEDAVRKCTSFPAQKLGLRDRGLISRGMWADITIFDPKKIKNIATYTDPHRYPKGILYVLVNGQLTLDESRHTGALAGKVLRHK